MGRAPPALGILRFPTCPVGPPWSRSLLWPLWLGHPLSPSPLHRALRGDTAPPLSPPPLTTAGVFGSPEGGQRLRILENVPPEMPPGPTLGCTRDRVMTPGLWAVWTLEDSQGLQAHTPASLGLGLSGLNEPSLPPPVASPPSALPTSSAADGPHRRCWGRRPASSQNPPCGPQGSSCSLPHFANLSTEQWRLTSPQRYPEARWGGRRVSMARSASLMAPRLY